MKRAWGFTEHCRTTYNISRSVRNRLVLCSPSKLRWVYQRIVDEVEVGKVDEDPGQPGAFAPRFLRLVR
jgi:hypothetical protein